MAHILVVHPKQGFRDLIRRALHAQHELNFKDDLPSSGPCDAILCGWDKAHTIRIFEKALEQWPEVRLIPVFSTLDQVAEFATMWNADPKRKGKNSRVGKEWLRESFTMGEILALFPASVQTRIPEIAASAAENDRPVLIMGERSTGKRTLAEQIHQRSSRGKAGAPFKVFNCEDSFEDQHGLFGRVLTDASGRTQGSYALLEVSDGGTLVLAGIEHAAKPMQLKLLSLLEDATMSYLRAGSRKPASVDVRVMATANCPLRPLLGDFFSEDLFYLLGANYIEIPRLHHRQAELIQIATEFCKRARAKAEGEDDSTPEPPAEGTKSAELISPRAETILRAYPWPGNFRELKFAMRYAALRGQGQIDTIHLPAYIANAATRKADESPSRMLPE